MTRQAASEARSAGTATQQAQYLTPESGKQKGSAMIVDLSDKYGGQWSNWKYPSPPAKRGVIEQLHGREIKDPWRELESLESEETQRFIRAQNELSKPLLDVHPQRKLLEEVVRKNYTYERTSAPMLQGDGYYYWMYNKGYWPRDVVVRSQDLQVDYGRMPVGIDEESGKTIRRQGADANGGQRHAGPEVVFNLNDEHMTSLYNYSWSPCGRYFCAILQEAGGDWQKIRTIDTTTKRPIEDDLTDSKFTFGTTWIGSSGFLYKRPITSAQSNSSQWSFPGADGEFGIHYHHLGTPQSEDAVIWHGRGEDGQTLIIGRPRVCTWDVSEKQGGRRWLFFDIYRNTNPESECFFLELPVDLEEKQGRNTGHELRRLAQDAKWLCRGYTGTLRYVGTLTDDTHLFKSTTDGATQGRILAFSARDFDAAAPKATIPSEDLVPLDTTGLNLLNAYLINDSIIALIYLKHACAAVVFVDARTGRPIGSSDKKGTRGHARTEPHPDIPVPPEEIPAQAPVSGTHATVIPAHATISTVSSRSDSPNFYLSVDTFVSPPYVLTGTVVPASPHEGDEEPDIKISRLDRAAAPEEDMVCSQTFYESFDGTKIPLFISHARDLDLSRPQPTLLYAYGGSAMSITPTFNPFFTTFMRHFRGILAVACIRGGGEYGKQWHDCAVGKNRYICFEDFCHAAKYLHAHRLTVPSLTATYGHSNGGLLLSASMNRHPELFGAMCPDVGVHDLTRFHKFTLGRLWTAEYGNPDDPELMPIIHSMSPVHNVNPDPAMTYPAVFITTGDHDNRVIPGHSLKLMAELQQSKPNNGNIFLGRIYENAGHESASKSTAQKVEQTVDRLIFILSTLRR